MSPKSPKPKSRKRAKRSRRVSPGTNPSTKPKVKSPRKSRKSSSSAPAALHPSQVTIRPSTDDILEQFGDANYTQQTAKRYIARVLFISGAATIPTIAKKLEMSEGTLRTWHTRDNWRRLRQQVTRFAHKEAVTRARKSMGVYAKNIDSELNAVLATVHQRLDKSTNTDLEQVVDESVLLKLSLEVMRTKIALLRTLTYGSQGKALAPHPMTVDMEGTAALPQPGGGVLATTQVEALLQQIPEYMKEAAKFVLAVDPDEDIDMEVLEAVAHVVDARERTSGGDEVFFGEEDARLKTEILVDADDEEDEV